MKYQCNGIFNVFNVFNYDYQPAGMYQTNYLVTRCFQWFAVNQCFHQTKCQSIKVGPIIGHGPESKNDSDRLKQNSSICYQVWIVNDRYMIHKTSATSGHNLTQIPWEETLRNFSAWDEAWILTLLCNMSKRPARIFSKTDKWTQPR